MESCANESRSQTRDCMQTTLGLCVGWLGPKFEPSGDEQICTPLCNFAGVRSRGADRHKLTSLILSCDSDLRRRRYVSVISQVAIWLLTWDSEAFVICISDWIKKTKTFYMFVRTVNRTASSSIAIVLCLCIMSAKDDSQLLIVQAIQ